MRNIYGSKILSLTFLVPKAFDRLPMYHADGMKVLLFQLDMVMIPSQATGNQFFLPTL